MKQQRPKLVIAGLTRGRWNAIKFQGEAPPGMVFVCRACGRTSNTRAGFGDVSCTLNALLAREKKDAEGKYRLASVQDVRTWVFRVQAHAWLSRGVSGTHE